MRFEHCCLGGGLTKTTLLSLSLVLAALSFACASSKSGLTEKSLRNATYELPGIGRIALSDGRFESATGAGATEISRASLVTFALGELNGDGAADAAAIIAWNGGGSGTFYNLVAVINHDGAGAQTAVQELGDRVKLNSMVIKDRVIIVDLVTQGPDDPLCCPTLEKKLSYQLKGGSLEILPSR